LAALRARTAGTPPAAAPPPPEPASHTPSGFAALRARMLGGGAATPATPAPAAQPPPADTAPPAQTPPLSGIAALRARTGAGGGAAPAAAEPPPAPPRGLAALKAREPAPAPSNAPPTAPASAPAAAPARPSRAPAPPPDPEPIPVPAATARLMRELPDPGEGTRRFMARGEALRRRALNDIEGALLPPNPDKALTERMKGHLTQTLSVYDLDGDVDRAVGGVVRRVLWGVFVLAIAIAAWLGFHIVIGG
jgi:hypothetical protein